MANTALEPSENPKFESLWRRRADKVFQRVAILGEDRSIINIMAA